MILIQLCFAFTIYAQNITVTGKVTDASSGEELPGVNVILKGTTKGTITMADGTYTLEVPATNAVLQFSFIGYTLKEVPVNGNTTVNAALETETTQLDEVIAVGYGTARRRDLTGSVSTVNSETLKKIPVANAAEAIKGRLPGVNIITTDGSPDAEIVIRVRGGGSVTQDNSPLYVVDGFITSSIRGIPPNDIANITVLKDAAATAIYGAQAANGVILITTKSPTEGRTTVSYNGYVKISTLPQERKYDVLDPYEFVMMQYEYAALRSDADLRNFERYYGKYDDLELYQKKPYTDWQDELFGDPVISQSHNVSISGGTAKTKMSLSLTSDNEEGIMIGNGYKRNVINFKLNHDISNKLKLEAQTRITDTKVDGAGTSGSSQLRVKNVITARPLNGIADELDIDLTTVDSDDDYQSFLLSLINPVELAKQDWRQRNTTTYVLQGGLTWEAMEGLTLKSTISSSQSYEERLRYYGPLTSTAQQQGNSLPLGDINNRKNTSIRWLNTAQYVFQDLGEHNLDIMLGHEVYSNGGKSDDVRAINFRESMQPDEMFANMALGTVVSYSTSQSTDQNRLSFFGRANYQFKNKYLLTATLRSDASSKFSKDNRVGIFPAVALGWKINEEAFMANANNIDELKLRLSYGETGNDRIPANATKFLFSADTNNGPGMGTNAYNAYYSPDGSTLYNPNILWETTVNQNIGLDFMFFGGRLSGSLDAYNNKTKDLLLASAISPISGFSTQWNNIGSTSNKGFEMMLNATLIETGDFQFRTNFNFGINKSRIEELDGTDERFIQSNWASTDLKDRDDYYLAVGETIGLIYGYVNDGMYTVDDFSGYNEVSGTYTLKDGVPDNKNTLGVSSLRPGYMKLKDISGPDGKPDGVINSMDRKVIGSALPDAFGGFSFEATWKGFDASVLFNWMVGNDVYNSGKIDYNQLYRTRYGNMLADMSSDKRFTYINVADGSVITDLEELRQLNQDKTIWSGSNSFGQATAVVNDWAVEDGSFLRLSTLTLGYTIPTNISSKVGISQFRLYATGYNLWLWTKYSGYDPEVSTSRSSNYGSLIQGLDYSSYPRSRSFTFGVNVTF
ncbi:SusC/RagA family TonB-linked outer membrane protein [Maribellus sediminis]|uniref:SusC/RagA family TonB-linked outer membrane protein n=1 Tax=Maribellus sediminis TaxID=2696285 RepID=UPI00142FF8BB|nr:TonB-dependent receptor [Maribellus sediminis]